ncbi:hypothetical protein HMI55_000457 [Coelomomyces lativittatus]|nr:hypothetical protein HMI55_000457 [Coelomomyces lativittatus]
MWYRGKVYGSSFTCFKRRRPLTSMAPSLPTPSKSVPTTPTWAPKPWQSIRVGDMVYLQNNESIPADILILSTSEPDHVCYVETQSLDGETNLKIKKAPSTSSISPSFINPLTCSTFQAMIQVDAPVANLSQFHGVLFTSTSKTFLTMASLLLRGCTLRNTSWVIGIVMYTGEDTKLVLNSGSTPSKLTQIDARLNPHVIMNFLILFTMSVVSTVTHMIYISSFDFERAVFNSKTEPMGWISGSTLALTTFLLSLIVFQTLIPISLFVTTEVVKTIQAYFIHSDLQLYDVHRDVPCVVHAWTLADDLGQVEYIFSDKTGTLTKNEMVFHACSIRGTLYGVGLDHTLLMEHDLMQKRNEAFHQLLLSHTSLAFNYDLSKFPRNFNDLHLIPSLIQPHSDATLFFLALALCHTVLPEKVTHVDTQVTQMTYKAQSPDEAALVIAAHQVGITFLSRSKQSVCVDVLGQIMEFEVLEILEFDSNRKRMSVLLVHPHHSKILVVCKGADSVIFERLHSDQQTLGQTTLHHLLHFSNQGLRTLCLAYRYLEYPFFLNWHRQYQTIMTHLDHPNRQEMISHLINQVESEFTLLGATAIEDKLQDQVPETIQKLMAARLKIWVLTGDKLETAISIGFSCHLLQPSMTLIVIQGDAVDEIHKQLEEAFFMVLQLPQPCRHSHSHSQERSERRRRFRLRRRRCRHRHDSNTMPSLTSSSSNLSAQDEDHEVTPSLLHSSSSSSASLKEGEANIDLHLSTQVASLQPTQNDDVLVASLDVLDVKMDPNRLSITEPVLCDLKQVPSSFSSSSSSSSSSLSFKDRNRHSTAESSMPTMVNEKDMEDDLFENEILSSPTHLDDPSSSTHSTHSFALVLDGTALKHALGADLKLLFLEVACRCTAVMCCRVSPKQKADVVGRGQ